MIPDHARQIEKQLAEIDAKIKELEQMKEAILESDVEYAEYCKSYRAYYQDDPLPIRFYYTYKAELQTLIKELDQAFQDDQLNGSDCHEEAWRKHYGRIRLLERRLAA